MSKYVILEAGDPDTLANKVERYLANNWNLVGGVSITLEIGETYSGDSYRYYTYYQAVAK